MHMTGWIHETLGFIRRRRREKFVQYSLMYSACGALRCFCFDPLLVSGMLENVEVLVLWHGAVIFVLYGKIIVNNARE
jgi:hypothetical protein